MVTLDSYGFRILKIILLVVAGLVGVVIVFVGSYWSLAKLVHRMEPSDESLRTELALGARTSGLLLADFHSLSAAVITFADPHQKEILNRIGHASITPDGRHLFVIAGLGGDILGPGAGIVRADGTIHVRFTRDLWRVVKRNAKYLLSNDLTKLCALNAKPTASAELYSLASPQVERLSIPENLQRASAASWGPSSSKIAFESAGSIYVYGLEDQSTRFLADGADPAWAPAGDWIAYRSPQQEAMIIKANGGQPQHLMKGVRVVSGFIWSPDAQYLAFSREYPLTFPLDSPGYLGVYRMRDGARYIAALHSFKGMPPTGSYGWLYAPDLISGE